jgi:parallel beta-helix repeat protein
MPDRVSRCFLLLTLFMLLLILAVDVTPVADLEGIAAQSTTMVSEPEKRGMFLAGTPHSRIVINGDTNFSDTALVEGWPGDGSPESPYIIDGLDIDLGGEYGHCISISNTRVSFTIRNCNLTRAIGEEFGAGINLENVAHGKLVNNIVEGNRFGVFVASSNYSTISDNICNSNEIGIHIIGTSEYSVGGIAMFNTVVNNTCTSNGESGICLQGSESNTVVSNTCYKNAYGIRVGEDFGMGIGRSSNNAVADNVCNNNGIGIYLRNSEFNTVVNNTCNSNTESGIQLNISFENTVVNNTCLDNTEYEIYLLESDFNTVANNITGFNPVVLLLIVLIGVTLLGAGWWKIYARGDPDDIIIPIRYRLVSWWRNRRALKHVDVEEPPELDSSDQ